MELKIEVEVSRGSRARATEALPSARASDAKTASAFDAESSASNSATNLKLALKRRTAGFSKVIPISEEMVGSTRSKVKTTIKRR